MQASQNVEDYMSKNTKTIAPDAGLIDALLLTCSTDVRHLPVIKDGKMIGIISDRDIKRALPTKQSDKNTDIWDALEEVKVESVMTTNVMTTTKSTDLRSAATVMMREKVSALPVVDAEGALEGIITTEDILWAYITEE